jgi:hypothetical protein
MSRLRGARPSPVLIVSILALVAALAGSAVASPTASTSVSKSKTKKIAKKQANKQIDKRLPWTNGDIADNAISTGKVQDNAISTGKVQDNAISTGKVQDAAVTPEKLSAGAIPGRAFGEILSGNVSSNKPSSGITSANVSHPSSGINCISGLSFTPNGALGTVRYDNLDDDEIVHTQLGVVAPCPAGTQISTSVFDPGTPGLENEAFTIWIF